MTSPAPAPDQPFAATAQWLAAVLADAAGWPFDDDSLARYGHILDGVETSVAGADHAGLARCYDELVTLGARVRDRSALATATATVDEGPVQRGERLRAAILGMLAPASGTSAGTEPATGTDQPVLLYAPRDTPTYAPQHPSYLRGVGRTVLVYVVAVLAGAAILWAYYSIVIEGAG